MGVELVQEYQCPGCVSGPFEDCYKSNINKCISCINHVPGTTLIHYGKIFLALPKGFNRLGEYSKVDINIYESYDDMITGWGEFNMFNVPVWKHFDGLVTLIKVFSPRVNRPCIMIIAGNCLDKVKCLNITNEDIQAMD